MGRNPTLDALGHAVSGSVGTAISTAALAPLDLITTRLKAKHRADSPQYDGIIDTFRAIVRHEGGVLALYNGFAPEVAKSILDSFLFFGFYSYLRQHRRTPTVAQELAIGAFAGACTKALTTPLSNVVTRKQTEMPSDYDSLVATMAKIRGESGLVGLWSGYSATVVLTLNPSITFFVNRRLAAHIIPALEEDDIPTAWIAFILAATSKALATAMTYPFQAAKTQLQMPSDEVEKKKYGPEACATSHHSGAKALIAKAWRLLNMTVFAMIYRIVNREGIRGLYHGLHAELIKSFFSHGLTMFTKGLIHRWIFHF